MLLNGFEQVKLLAEMAASGRVPHERVEAKARSTLDLAEQSGVPTIVTVAHCLLAAHAPFSEALDHLESCAATAEEHDCRKFEFNAWVSLAERAADLQVSEAQRALERARSLYFGSMSRSPLAAEQAWIRSLLAALRLRIGPRDEAVAEVEAALRSMERLRAEQRVEFIRASAFGGFAGFYHSYAAYVLGDPDATPTIEMIDDAFAIVERMRARVLLDRLALAAALPEEDPDVLRRAAVLTEIAGVQQRLADPQFPRAQREQRLAELERLELEETELRAEIFAAHALPAALQAPGRTSVAEVQRARLLRPALQTLDAPPRRLVIVAEGPLARLPFDALRETTDGPMLGGRLETVVVPSVTTWLHWRNGREEGLSGPVLAVADPTLPSPTESSSGGARQPASGSRPSRTASPGPRRGTRDRAAGG